MTEPPIENLTRQQIIMRQPHVREKCRLGQLGSKKSDEVKAKISAGAKVDSNRPEVKARRRARFLENNPMKSEESRAKVAASKVGKKMPDRGPAWREKIKVKRAKQILPFRDTRPERLLQAQLELLAIKFHTHQCLKGAPKLGLYHQYDVVIPKLKLVIEMNGCYWHGCPKCFPVPSDAQKRTIERDAFIVELTATLGWRLVTIWEHDVENLSELVQAAVTR